MLGRNTYIPALTFTPPRNIGWKLGHPWVEVRPTSSVKCENNLLYGDVMGCKDLVVFEEKDAGEKAIVGRCQCTGVFVFNIKHVTYGSIFHDQS